MPPNIVPAPGPAHDSAAAAPRPTTLGGDVLRFGAAILFATGFGVVQVFVIPRRLDVAGYGAYRVFLLYVGYLGLLHAGLADGAFVRWAGRRRATIRREWMRVAVWLLVMDGGVLAAALVAAPFVPAGLPRTYVVAFAACALAQNMTLLAGYALQTAGDFRAAGLVTAVGPGLFVAAVLAAPIHSVAGMVAAYVGAFAAGGLVGAWMVARLARGAAPPRPADGGPRFGALVHQGLPVLGANTAAGLSQFADRILVSVSVPLVRFALYGFASSVMVAASAATRALTRVSLSHAAHRPEAERAQFLGEFYHVIAAGFGAALAGVPLFEHLVITTLPAYAAALPIMRALAVGAAFWVAIHVVVVGTLQSFGHVRRQLMVELIGLAAATLVCGAALRAGAALWMVAAGAAAAAGATWIVGVAVVRRIVPTAAAQPAARFAVCVLVPAAAMLAATGLAAPLGWEARTLIYAAVAAAPTMASGRSAWRHLRR